MSSQSTPAARIAARASIRHGIVDAHDLSDLGIASSTVRAWVASGRVHRLHRNVYSVVPPSLISHEGRWLAAVLACGPGAALSYQAAAEHVGLIERWRRRVPLHVSLIDRRKVRLEGIIVHRPRHLEERDIKEHNGIRTTSATRTLFDLTSVVTPTVLRELFERAEYLEELDRARLRTLLIGATGRRGLRALRDLAGFEPIPLSRIRSKLEGIILKLCRTHSLPVPGVNVPFGDYELDFFWPAARLVVEADGGRHVRERRATDNERDLRLQLAGHLVRRYSEEALEEEPAVSRELLHLLMNRLPA
jgi:hypothetical protein